MEKNLFTGIKIGNIELKNRIVMAPMTRSRAPETFATELTAKYYAQRASAGLIITEGTQISEQGIGYPWTPGINTPEHAKAWKVVTDAVHAEGGKIFAQIWHVGRQSHSVFHNGELPVAPSAVGFPGKQFTHKGMLDLETPRALDIEEIPGVVNDYAKAALLAMEAGFDGVEIHGANGYLVDQFINSNSNKRDDKYGGSVENRGRFALEVVEAVVNAIGSERVGIRLSPAGFNGGMFDANPVESYGYVIKNLSKFNLAYLHLLEGPTPKDDQQQYQIFKNGVAKVFRPMYDGTIIINAGYTKEKANAVIASGDADLVSFGVPFLSNPDLPERFRTDSPLNPVQGHETFYGGGEKGYTDYPTQKEVAETV
ncbi:MAG: alkene reductase [Ignavibacteriales bacterium]|nr:alkene reductase [Ignavibacteriales bacterium]